jgi:hypothetical protein
MHVKNKNSIFTGNVKGNKQVLPIIAKSEKSVSWRRRRRTLQAAAARFFSSCGSPKKGKS